MHTISKNNWPIASYIIEHPTYKFVQEHYNYFRDLANIYDEGIIPNVWQFDGDTLEWTIKEIGYLESIPREWIWDRLIKTYYYEFYEFGGV